MTPEMLAAYYGGHWDERDYVRLDVERMHYCAKCEVGQAATGSVECWVCGEPMSLEEPHWWPPLKGESTVRFEGEPSEQPEQSVDLF